MTLHRSSSQESFQTMFSDSSHLSEYYTSLQSDYLDMPRGQVSSQSGLLPRRCKSSNGARREYKLGFDGEDSFETKHEPLKMKPPYTASKYSDTKPYKRNNSKILPNRFRGSTKQNAWSEKYSRDGENRSSGTDILYIKDLERKYAQVKQQLALKADEVENLRTQINHEKYRSNDLLNEKRELEIRCTNLQKTYAEKLEEVSTLKVRHENTFEAAEKMLLVSKDENIRYKKKLQNAEKLAEEKQREVVALKAELKDLKHALDEQRSKNQEISEKAVKLVEKKEKEIKLMREQMKELQANLEKFQMASKLLEDDRGITSCNVPQNENDKAVQGHPSLIRDHRESETDISTNHSNKEAKELKEKYTSEYILRLGLQCQLRDFERKLEQKESENTLLKEELEIAKKKGNMLQDGMSLGGNVCKRCEEFDTLQQENRELKYHLKRFEDENVETVTELTKRVSLLETGNKSATSEGVHEEQHHWKVHLPGSERPVNRSIKEAGKSSVSYFEGMTKSLPAKAPKSAEADIQVAYKKKCKEVQRLLVLIEEKEKQLKLLQTEKADLQVKYEKAHKDLNDALVLNDKMKNQLKALERPVHIDKRGKAYRATELWERVQEIEAELGLKKDELIAKERRIEDLTQRLSLEMGKKISSDESSLENICNRIRPTTIAEAYELLCSNEWLGAKQALDTHHGDMSENKRLRILCKVFETSFDKAKISYAATVDILGYLIQNPNEKAMVMGYTYRGYNKNEKMLSALYSALRLSAEDTNIDDIARAIREDIKKYTSSGALYNTEFQKYINAVARIGWHMVIQQPPMKFDQSGIGEAWKGDSKQIPFWTSSNPSKSRVKLYVHPALFHGELLMVKGRVVLE